VLWGVTVRPEPHPLHETSKRVHVNDILYFPKGVYIEDCRVRTRAPC
jgi:hypothetical protein